jgi:hypothetical protein
VGLLIRVALRVCLQFLIEENAVSVMPDGGRTGATLIAVALY